MATVIRLLFAFLLTTMVVLSKRKFREWINTPNYLNCLLAGVDEHQNLTHTVMDTTEYRNPRTCAEG